MFTRKMFMDARLIHLKASVEPTRICFPYDWQKAAEDDQTLVYEDTCNSGIQDFDDIADIKVYAMIKPQTCYIRCHFKVEVTAGDGSTYTRNRMADMPDQDACKVLNSFFAMGAPGMDIEFSALFRRYRDAPWVMACGAFSFARREGGGVAGKGMGGYFTF